MMIIRLEDNSEIYISDNFFPGPVTSLYKPLNPLASR
jgi:hypothetical protein